MANRHHVSVVSCVLAATMLVVLGESLINHVEAQSLKDAARASGGKTVVTMTANVPFGSLSRVTEVAAVIVHGQVTKTEARLSKNEEYVSTYVTVAPTQILKGAADASPLRRPGFIPAIVFVEPGGTVKVDGLEMTYRDRTASDPPLQIGDEVIAFLAKGDEAGLFTLPYGGYSLLRVHGDRVEGANKQVAQRQPLESYKLVDVQRTIRELIAASKQ